MYRIVSLALLALGSLATPVYAELVFFQSGRAMSVRAIRSDGSDIIIQLRGGSAIRCQSAVRATVRPDLVDDADEARAPVHRDLAPIPAQFRDLIARVAAHYGVDARIVDAVVQVESAYDSHAVSAKGARGLMQLMPATGRLYGALDLFD